MTAHQLLSLLVGGGCASGLLAEHRVLTAHGWAGRVAWLGTAGCVAGLSALFWWT